MKKLILSLFLLSMIASPVLAEDVHLDHAIDQVQEQLEESDMPSFEAIGDEVDHMGDHIEEELDAEPEYLEESEDTDESDSEKDF